MSRVNDILHRRPTGGALLAGKQTNIRSGSNFPVKHHNLKTPHIRALQHHSSESTMAKPASKTPMLNGFMGRMGAAIERGTSPNAEEVASIASAFASPSMVAELSSLGFKDSMISQHTGLLYVLVFPRVLPQTLIITQTSFADMRWDELLMKLNATASFNCQYGVTIIPRRLAMLRL